MSNEAHALHAAGVRYLVRVGHHRRGAVWRCGRGEGARRHHRALDVHVSLDEAGDEQPARAVYLLGGLVAFADSDYYAVLDRYVGALYLHRAEVREARVPEHGVARFFLHRVGKKIFEAHCVTSGAKPPRKMVKYMSKLEYILSVNL